MSGGETPHVRAHVRKALDRAEFAGALLVRNAVERHDARVRLAQLLFQLRALRADLLGALFVLLRARRARRGERVDLLRAAEGIFHVVRSRLELTAEGGDPLADDLRFARLVLHADLEQAQFFVERAQIVVRLGDRSPALFLFRIDGGEPLFDGGELAGRVVDLLALFARLVREIIEPHEVGVDLFVFEFFGIGAELFRRLRLLFEGAELVFRLVHTLDEHGEVVLRVFELALDLALLRLELHDARRLFKDGAAVLGLGVHDLLDLALPDDGVALFPDADAVQKRDDVFEAAGLHIEQILALARTVQAAGHGDFVVLDVEHSVRVVEYQRDFAVRERTARLRAAENDVLHGRAAQGLGGLLAEHPTHRVGNVALAAAVGSDDDGNAVVEFNGGLVREGLEPHKLHFLEIHGCDSIPYKIFAAATSAAFLFAPAPCASLPSARTVLLYPFSAASVS